MHLTSNESIFEVKIQRFISTVYSLVRVGPLIAILRQVDHYGSRNAVGQKRVKWTNVCASLTETDRVLWEIGTNPAYKAPSARKFNVWIDIHILPLFIAASSRWFDQSAPLYIITSFLRYRFMCYLISSQEN